MTNRPRYDIIKYITKFWWIMNWYDHEYLVPVFLGNDSSSIETAKQLRKLNSAKAHIFAENFGFLQKFSFICHRVTPMRNDLLLLSLLDFSKDLEEYRFPVIIYSDNMQNFISSNLEELESRFMIISCSDANALIKEKKNDFK